MPEEPRFKTLLILGAPGSGKGTQGKVLGTIPRFYHCACGDVFRSLDTRTEIGQEFVKFASKGQLVPDDITVKLWRASIKSQVELRTFKPDIDFLVLDGIPRNVEQARLMEQYVDVLQVFHLTCPDRDELSRRLKKRALKDNRFDDASDTVIKRRLETYEEETKPVLDYYSADRVAVINAQQPPVKVCFDILDRIMQIESWKELSKKVW